LIDQLIALFIHKFVGLLVGHSDPAVTCLTAVFDLESSMFFVTKTIVIDSLGYGLHTIITVPRLT